MSSSLSDNIIIIANDNPGSVFFLLSFSLSLSLWYGILSWIFNISSTTSSSIPKDLLAWFYLGNLAPMIVGIGLTGSLEGESGLKRLLRQFVIIPKFSLLLFLIAFLSIPVCLFWMYSKNTFDLIELLQIAQEKMWLLLPSTIGLAVSAEFGWRGFLIPHLMKHGMAPLRVASVIGIFQAIYVIFPTIVQHHDLISKNAKDNRQNIWNLISLILLYGPSISFPVSIILCWIYLTSKGSLLLTTVSHGYLYATIFLIGGQLFDHDLSKRVKNVAVFALIVIALSIIPAVSLFQDGIARNKRLQLQQQKNEESKKSK
jgi:hypothetical protein